MVSNVVLDGTDFQVRDDRIYILGWIIPFKCRWSMQLRVFSSKIESEGFLSITGILV